MNSLYAEEVLTYRPGNFVIGNTRKHNSLLDPDVSAGRAMSNGAAFSNPSHARRALSRLDTSNSLRSFTRG